MYTDITPVQLKSKALSSAGIKRQSEHQSRHAQYGRQKGNTKDDDIAQSIQRLNKLICPFALAAYGH
ncbi:hypothetical protein HRJ35_21050 [Shewanella oneidensis MR-1]|uniref:hypothetical protein n=1 Tax=Shewanella oneidensis TaxID=70863 RepID=UPI00000E23EB|nr:hypothetical protein [Shewanella oneidensis]MDX5998714.1 hypothetical protein [Shewanella oneidensis]QKG98247.1 hypothetical protein HRJ35_21050 [Shewanella oneidensis MR-1]